MAELSLQQASAIVDGALAKARAMKLLPMTIVVVDRNGVMKAMKREDGTGLIGPDMVFGKAFGAVSLGRSSGENATRMSGNPGLVAALSAASGGKFIAARGAVLIFSSDGEMIGAVGAGGDTGEADEVCSAAGVAAAGLKTSA
ncbi:MAG: heme-binding protein [Alphaproteobacteria bacterium]|nr:heme-binding protein [Alphaproteobacteria bacterium]